MRIYSEETRQKARKLRRNGWSLGEISQKMGIPKNTLTGWAKDIHLTPSQRKRIKEKEIRCAAIGRKQAVEAWRNKIAQWKKGIQEHVTYLNDLPLENPGIGKLICGVLYLCEGSKYPSTRCLIFGNSDPLIIQCFLQLLRNYFNIEEGKLRCRVLCRCDQNVQELNQYWSHVTGIPLIHFYKTTPDRRTKGIPTRRKDYHGVCTIQYSDTSLQFELQTIGEITMKRWS